jgi:lipopolysaccharide biosynthesis protein
MPKILALYLPQFHETPENNEWWGKGFTEWTNTSKATKLFKDHYQPRIPLNNKYYDLSDPVVMKEQAETAKKYGVDGFCYYHYWFNGKQMLHKPLIQMLATPGIDIPFCLSWANDSWNKAWDGEEKQVLIKQEYGVEENWQEHLDYLLPYFKDPRYIRENNKPVFFIYRTIGFDRMEEMIRYWGEKLVAEGFDGIHIVETLNSFQQEPSCESSAAVFTFEPMLTLRKKISLVNKVKGRLNILLGKQMLLTDSYDRVWKEVLENAGKQYGNKEVYRGAFVDWDNSPRKANRGLVVTGASPAKFGKYISKLLNISRKQGNSYLVVNAWNEWAEGCYLEADEKFGYGYLEQLKAAITKTNQTLS